MNKWASIIAASSDAELKAIARKAAAASDDFEQVYGIDPDEALSLLVVILEDRADLARARGDRARMWGLLDFADRIREEQRG